MTRKWFQIHLSTAIVLMLVASCMLWLNMQPIPNYKSWKTIATADKPPLDEYGWPCTCVSVLHKDYLYRSFEVHYTGWIWAAACMNAAIILTILLTVAVLCESIIRRRERGRLPAETKDVGL